MNLDLRERLLWHNLACESLIKSVYITASISNLGMANEEAWKTAIESGCKMSIFDPDLKSNIEEKVESKTSFDSIEEYHEKIASIKLLMGMKAQ